ncbi:replication protein [Chengkuizengella marina]|uniref:Bacteriophage lambda Replication protein O N-terminal domain-containing protein n=1 Tax=Chengkuizengella marina TaxID=2507566 RepID=A0A6N9Q988_9BACL|nr:replication protein [Chengkuizengella marina]NBI31251.1 hypothetical protein [Chengkuizengella marina]
MANPQIENGYTKISNEILDHMCRIKLSPTQYRILFVVWRYTYGFNRKAHKLSLSFIEDATGVDVRNIRRSLEAQEDRKIIIQKIEKGKAREIIFNKNYEEWADENEGKSKPTMGKTTHGQNDPMSKLPMGETAHGTMGEIAQGAMGETAHQEINLLNKNLNTVSQLEENEISESENEIMKIANEVEKHYCIKRNILNASPVDFQEIKTLAESEIPIEFIKMIIDQTFANYKPKHPRDQIRRFSYCSTAIYDEWVKHQEKMNKQTGSKPSKKSYSRSGKPIIPMMTYTDQQDTVSKEDLERLQRLANEWDGERGVS